MRKNKEKKRISDKKRREKIMKCPLLKWMYYEYLKEWNKNNPLKRRKITYKKRHGKQWEAKYILSLIHDEQSKIIKEVFNECKETQKRSLFGVRRIENSKGRTFTGRQYKERIDNFAKL